MHNREPLHKLHASVYVIGGQPREIQLAFRGIGFEEQALFS